MTNLVAYLRVSTKKQGDSGLGLEAQRAAVEAYAQSIGAKIIAEYPEIESGKVANRPKLAQAIAHAKRAKARLCIAKLDRLSRNVSFLAMLMDSGLDFVCCDNPSANKLTLHILSAVAEAEREAISARTTAALKAAKARGVKLGSALPGHWDGREDARLAGLAKARKVTAAKRHARALAAVADLLPQMQEMRAAKKSFREIADALNAAGKFRGTNEDGKDIPWNIMGIKRCLDRAAEAK